MWCLGPGGFRCGGMSGARLDAFNRGRISAFAEEGYSAAAIAEKVRKKDGTRPQKRAVEKTLAKFRKSPKWKGTDSSAGGRHAKISKKTRKQLLSLVIKERGSRVVG